MNRSLYRDSPNYREGYRDGALAAAVTCFVVFTLAVVIGTAIGLSRW